MNWRHRLAVICIIAVALISSNMPSYTAWAQATTGGLSADARDNLVAFTRVFGYVRYFYPGDAAAVLDWETFAIRYIESVEDADISAELVERLQQLFQPYAPTIQIYASGTPPQPPIPELPGDTGGLQATRWVHTGGMVRQKTASDGPSKRTTVPLQDGKLPEGFTDAPYVADVGRGVTVRIPLVLVADSKGTLPHIDPPALLPLASKPTLMDRASRLANVAIAWNAIQHGWSYFDVMKVDWDAALAEALTNTASEQYKGTATPLRLMMNRLNDGHATAWNPNTPGFNDPTFALPFQFDFVEGKWVVVQAKDSLQNGDVVLTIDGEPADKVFARSIPRISAATDAARRHRQSGYIVYGAKDSTATFEVQGIDGQKRTVAVKRSIPSAQVNNTILEPRPNPVAELQSGIFYIDLTRATDLQIAEVLPNLERATGIIFDQRGYPSPQLRLFSPFRLLGHLSAKTITTPPFLVPVITQPDHRNIEYQNAAYNIENHEPVFNAKIAFLSNANGTQSFAETVLGIVDGNKLGAIVGAPSSGTNGNAVDLTLPDGTVVRWTSLRVTKFDSSPLLGVGITPTVPVSRTIAGIATGKDEILERAIGVVRGN
jgi:hypothetical protein